MATTTLVIDIPEGLSPVLAFLSPTAAGQVTPNAAGYVMTVSPSEHGKYTISIAEALVGIYRIVCTDGDGIEVAVGYTQSLTDEAVTYWSDASYAFVYMDSVARSRADAALAAYDPPTKAELDAAIASVTSSIGGLNDLDAAGIRTAIGMASANLDTQLSTIDTVVDALYAWLENGGRLDSIFDAIKERTDLIGSTSATLNTNAATFTLIRNDTYNGTANPKPTFTVTKDFSSGWTGSLTIRHRVLDTVLVTVDVTVDSSTQLSAEFTSAETEFATLTTARDFGPHPFDLQMTHTGSGAKQTVVEGVCVIKRDEVTS